MILRFVERRRLGGKNPRRAQVADRALSAVLVAFLGPEGGEMARCAAHRIESRLVGALLRADHQVVAEIVEQQVPLDHAAFVRGGLRRQDEGRARKPGQHDRDAIGPVGDGTDTHPRSLRPARLGPG
ncbi:MAG: hypothetical protein WDN44_05710 [Sphingomonas sp.]